MGIWAVSEVGLRVRFDDNHKSRDYIYPFSKITTEKFRNIAAFVDLLSHMPDFEKKLQCQTLSRVNYDLPSGILPLKHLSLSRFPTDPRDVFSAGFTRGNMSTYYTVMFENIRQPLVREIRVSVFSKPSTKPSVELMHTFSLADAYTTEIFTRDGLFTYNPNTKTYGFDTAYTHQWERQSDGRLAGNYSRNQNGRKFTSADMAKLFKLRDLTEGDLENTARHYHNRDKVSVFGKDTVPLFEEVNKINTDYTLCEKNIIDVGTAVQRLHRVNKSGFLFDNVAIDSKKSFNSVVGYLLNDKKPPMIYFKDGDRHKPLF